MLRLYTSNTCPKGVAAREFFTGRQMPFEEVNLDAENGKAAEHRLRLLIRESQRNDAADIALPALTRQDGDQEHLVVLGFEPGIWEDVTQRETV